MSDAALQDYERARKEQLTRNEARRIRTRVAEARGAHHDAGIRWPFELLQNALDAGPLEGNNEINVLLCCEGNTVVFEHNGAAFSLQDLAALLSGGSSKEFESEETTGRFGTGFLVTHVLAERTRVIGLLRTGTRWERFALVLDRAGDERSIMENIGRCDEAIRSAEPVDMGPGQISARFEYLADDQEALLNGVVAFNRALPYLFATCPHLGTVTVKGPAGAAASWNPVDSSTITNDGVLTADRTLRVCGPPGEEHALYRSIRVSVSGHDESAAVVVLRKQENGWAYLVPEPEIPRIFRRFPLRSTHFLSVNAILDGRFDVDQERRTVLLNNEKTKELLKKAFQAIPKAVGKLMVEQCLDAHKLVMVGPLQQTFSDGTADRQWWSDELSSVAQQLARLPLVETRRGFGAAVPEAGDGWFADFIRPKLGSSDGPDETTLERLWSLVDEADDLYPPKSTLARDWSEIAKGWASLRVPVNQVTLEVLGNSVKQGASRITDLKVCSDCREWLVRFIDVVGECWAARRGVDLSLLQGLTPDQDGHLRSPGELKRDDRIPEPIKDIAESLGINIRSRLLDQTLADTAARLGLVHFGAAVLKAVPIAMGEDALIGECIAALDQKLDEGKRINDATAPLLEGSLRLIAYLWETKGPAASELVRKIPFLSASGSIVKWAREKELMAPVSNWHAAAQPYWKAYPAHRILAPEYHDATDRIPDLTPALVEWGIAIPDPISKDVPAELRDRRLAALADGFGGLQGVTVSGEAFSQIALLQPDVLNHCQEEEDARALLGLVLTYVAPFDNSWRERRVVRGRRGGEQVEIPVRGALWLADLRAKAWVPVKGDDGKTSKVEAAEASLRKLLDPTWLAGNEAAISILSECFGFDQLDLRLLGASPDPQVRQQLRDGLAKLLEAAGGDPATYADIARQIEEKQAKTKLVEACRTLGLAVQEAIGQCLEAHGLTVELVDRGFDFEVTLETGDIAEGSLRFEVGTFLVEVKATRDGEVRMTPKQAETAAAERERYVLCVVDLRSVPAERLENPWAAADVEPLAHVVVKIGNKVSDTWDLIEWARSEQVAIRNDKALRYGVPHEIWQDGIAISEWVAKIAKDA